jgi:hypothetical protein
MTRGTQDAEEGTTETPRREEEDVTETKRKTKIKKCKKSDKGPRVENAQRGQQQPRLP